MENLKQVYPKPNDDKLSIRQVPPPRHRPRPPDTRPPWCNKVYQPVEHKALGRINSYTVEESIPMPQAHYECMLADKLTLHRDGSVQQHGAAVLCRPRHATAPWCTAAPPRLSVTRHVTMGMGKVKSYLEPHPNNLRACFLQGSPEYAFVPMEPGAIITQARGIPEASAAPAAPEPDFLSAVQVADAEGGGFRLHTGKPRGAPC